MAYKINRELEWNQIAITSDSGVTYRILMSETCDGSNLWILNLSLESGEPSASEIYKTMSTVYDVLTEKDGILERNNVTEAIAMIQANSREEIDKKTKVFTRWIRNPWSFELIRDPVVDIQGRANKIYLKTNLIHMKKTGEYNHTEKDLINNFKFCFNCGFENKEYKFCPSCGTNLQQS